MRAGDVILFKNKYMNFNEVKFKHIDGTERQLGGALHKVLGEAVYEVARTKEMDVLSTKLFTSNGEVELDEREKQLLIEVVEATQFFMWVKTPVMEFLGVNN
jgi:hypothetical protein